MYIKRDYDFEDLKDNCWSGALYTLKTIADNDKEKELMSLLEEVFCNDIPTMTEVNDFLWFDSDYIFEQLDINEEEEEEEEE